LDDRLVDELTAYYKDQVSVITVLLYPISVLVTFLVIENKF